jgi:hypothetical protein
VVGQHPALSLARTACLTAQELRTYVKPEDPRPWALTSGDHVEILTQIDGALAMLSKCVSSIATTAEGNARRRLAEAASLVWQACGEIADARTAIESGSSEPAHDAVNQPAQVAAGNFPAPISGDVIQAAGAHPGSPATPGRTRPAAPTPGGGRAKSR